MEVLQTVARDCPRKLRSKRGRKNYGLSNFSTLYLKEKNYGCPDNLRPSHQSRDICLHPGHGDSDSKRYVEEVIRQNPDLELVEAGPLAVGYGVKGRIVHLNFKAKHKEEKSVYFAELTITNRDAVIINCVASLGPSDSLPKIADADACLYCCSHNNIHQPDYILHPILCGREQHLATVTYQVQQLLDFIAKGEQQVGFNPRFSHPGVKYITKHSQWNRKLIQIADLTEHANLALSLFNRLEGKSFVLLKIVHYNEAGFIGLGTVAHINFEAVNKDDPDDAQVQTFFAEVISAIEFIFADFCKCLGPSDLLPGEVDLHGCLFCKNSSRLIHHPPGLGYLTGREYVKDGIYAM